MNSLSRFAVAVFTILGAAALPAGAADVAAKSAPPQPIQAKVVDTPGMKPRPKPPKCSDPDPEYREYGHPVQVRKTPTKRGPVFALFAGGADVEVYGKPVKRDGVVWVDVDFQGVRGWVPQDRVSTESKEETSQLFWDIRFMSPSGKVQVEYRNRSIGGVYVLKDGTSREEYHLPLGPERNWIVTGMLFFSKDESCIALRYGGASYGTEVFVHGREGKGPFKPLELNLQERCWDLALKKGLLPAGAEPAHRYMAPEEALEQGFVVRLSGDYGGTGTGQTRFGPIRFVWTRKGDKLELAK